MTPYYWMQRRKVYAKKMGATIIEDVYALEVYKRSQGICGLCDNPVGGEEFVVEHKTPLTRGGQHTYENTHAAHWTCNNRKGNKTLEEYRSSLPVIVPETIYFDAWAIPL